MAPKVKITKQMVADAAFEVIRARGHEALNAKSIAERLGCSTQPVLYSFHTVDEIRQAAYEIADEYHTAFIMPGGTEENSMLALGLNYVRFGHDERNLFRFLFQTDKFGGKDIETLLSGPEMSGILNIMATGLQVDQEQARAMFLTFFCAAHGLASLLANNSMEYEEAQCRSMLESVFFGMASARKGNENAETV